MQDFFVGCAGRLPGVRERMACEKLQHLLFGGRIQHIFCGEFLGLNVIRSANARGGRVQIVIRVAKLDACIIAEEQPVGAGFAERHADAAGIHHARFANRAVELHVSVAADDEGRIRGRKNRREKLLGREARENLIFVARRGVTEEHVAKAGDFERQSFRPTRQQFPFVRRKFPSGPLKRRTSALRNCRGFAGGFVEDGKFTIAVNEICGNMELLQSREDFARHGAGDDVAADDDAINLHALDFAENGFERGKIAMNVIKSGDSHGKYCGICRGANSRTNRAMASPIEKAVRGRR